MTAEMAMEIEEMYDDYDERNRKKMMYNRKFNKMEF